MPGGRNVFGKAKNFYPRIPREEIYASRPDIIIDMGDMSETDHVTEGHKRSVTELWKQMPSLPAVREGRVYAVANDIFVVPGPRVVEAAQSLFRMIHPEASPRDAGIRIGRCSSPARLGGDLEGHLAAVPRRGVGRGRRAERRREVDRSCRSSPACGEDYEGECRFRGVEISQWRKGDLGRRLSFIPQNVRIEFPFTAEQVVYMGRTPHCNGLFETPEDREAVRRAMETTETPAVRPASTFGC